MTKRKLISFVSGLWGLVSSSIDAGRKDFRRAWHEMQHNSARTTLPPRGSQSSHKREREQGGEKSPIKLRTPEHSVPHVTLPHHVLAGTRGDNTAHEDIWTSPLPCTDGTVPNTTAGYVEKLGGQIFVDASLLWEQPTQDGYVAGIGIWVPSLRVGLSATISAPDNMAAEMMAINFGLAVSIALGMKKPEIITDALACVEQVESVFTCKRRGEDNEVARCAKLLFMLKGGLRWTARENNAEADLLSGVGSSGKSLVLSLPHARPSQSLGTLRLIQQKTTGGGVVPDGVRVEILEIATKLSRPTVEKITGAISEHSELTDTFETVLDRLKSSPWRALDLRTLLPHSASKNRQKRIAKRNEMTYFPTTHRINPT